MPLLETKASADTACVSTAPVFETSTGAAKAPDEGWWALVHHNSQGKSPGAGYSVVQSACWIVWLGALVSTAAIPHEEFAMFVAALCSLVLMCVFLPDDQLFGKI